MNGRYLLDTNVAIGVLNRDIDLASRQGQNVEVLLCLTVVGELLFGVAKSSRPKTNRRKIERLLELCPILPHDLGTAESYGMIKAGIQKQGRPIPENDVWIAACAIQHDLVLVTHDGHFDDVPGLRVEAW